jgi:hypothetical protein
VQDKEDMGDASVCLTAAEQHRGGSHGTASEHGRYDFTIPFFILSKATRGTKTLSIAVDGGGVGFDILVLGTYTI